MAQAKARAEAGRRKGKRAKAAAEAKVRLRGGGTGDAAAEEGGRPAKLIEAQAKGSGEEQIAKRLQDIARADSDESDTNSAGSAKVGKKRAYRRATHRMQHTDNLSETTLNELIKTKEHAEAQLELVKARTRDVDDSGTDSDDDKEDIEVNGQQSFSAGRTAAESRRFPNGGQFWRDTMLDKAEKAVDDFLGNPARKTNKIPPMLRRLMRLVAEVVSPLRDYF
ncbi:hypothetical protein B0H14DRAFT_3509908 [Mycena olivaceomarginata]|nr:hypothetical protein B0H14DRAFT_3509908 [Mycena olivaceomarginata]